MQYVIVGADGYLGSYLYKRLLEDGHDVIGTGHRRPNCMELVYYDILKSDIGNIVANLKDDDWTGIICIAEPNIDKCYMDYKRAYDINVIAIKKLICEMQQRNAKILFFSSDNVFDGTRGNYTEKDMTNPINAYGKMKEEMEQYLLDKQDTCVFRLSRVVSIRPLRQNVFFEWETQLKRNETIKCIRQNYNSFVWDEDIYQACLIFSQKKMSGLYNVAGDIALTRKELAQKFFSYLGQDDVNIVECSLDEFGFKDKRPLNVGMDNTKFRESTDYSFTSMESMIAEYVKQNGLVRMRN